MQPAEHDEAAARAVAIGQAIGAVGVRDVDLDDDEVGRVVEGQGLHVLVFDHRLVVWIEIGGERRQAEGREKRGTSTGRQNGLVASVSAGRMNLTRQRPPGSA